MNMCSIESHFALEARIDSLTAERDEAITRLLDEQKTHSETFLRLAAAERVVEAARTTRHAIAGLHRASWDDSGETDVHRQLLLDAEHNLLEQLIGYEKAYSEQRPPAQKAVGFGEYVESLGDLPDLNFSDRGKEGE